MKLRTFLICLAVSVGLLGAPRRVRGQDRDDCYRRVQRERRDVARAIDQHGYYSSQARHEREELQRDEDRCGYFDSRDRYDGRRRYDNYGSSPAFDIGYRDGIAVGQRDRESGKAFRPEKNDYYEDADRGYQKSFGDKGLYKRQYRESFRQGYAEGYDYRR